MTALPLWHLELVPGQSYPLMVARDFKITNAALGEEIVDENGRSVVKITHQPVNPRELGDDSDSDDEFSDDEDLEDDEEVDMEALKAAINGKKGKKADAAEEEEDDEGEDDEEDEDFEADAQTTAVLCSLIPGKIEQAQLNLVFVEDEVIMFEVTGKNTVHLMGNYINQETHSHGHDDYDDLSEEEDFSLDEDSEDEDVSMTEEASHRFEEVKEDPKPKKAEATAKETANKKRKAETQETDSKRSTASASEKKAATPNAAEKKPEQAAKKQKTDAAKPAEKKKEADEKPEQKSAKKQTLPSGLIIEDFKIGDGPVAKKGKRLGMRYIGKLMNGKQFDANTSGAPFNFRLGAGEVIKGWDQGLEGMRVGGERKLTIPAKLAYGSQKIPGIPSNSTLQFEVKLVNVK